MLNEQFLLFPQHFLPFGILFIISSNFTISDWVNLKFVVWESVSSTSLLKTLWDKQKLLVTSNFSFSHSVFHSFGELFFHLHRIYNFRLQTLSVWKSLKFVVSERVNKCTTYILDQSAFCAVV